VARLPDSRRRRAQSTLTRPAQVIKSALQFLGLAEEVVEKVSHVVCSASRRGIEMADFGFPCPLECAFSNRSQDDVLKHNMIALATHLVSSVWRIVKHRASLVVAQFEIDIRGVPREIPRPAGENAGTSG
jgi:hypothetical protein